jgi:hypothetical protein
MKINKMKTINEILQKLRSIELCLTAHPDNEPDSEFADRISDLQELQSEIPNYADQQSVEFAEWMNTCPYYPANDGWYAESGDSISTAELLTKFKEEAK